MFHLKIHAWELVSQPLCLISNCKETSFRNPKQNLHFGMDYQMDKSPDITIKKKIIHRVSRACVPCQKGHLSCDNGFFFESLM